MKRRAYTFIELLAVFAAVTTLAVLLLPTLARSAENANDRDNARRAACQTNLKMVGLGIMQYTQDYDERFPLASVSKSPAGNGQMLNEPYGWADAIQPYLKSTEILQCPEDRHPSSGNPTHVAYTDYWLNQNLAGRSYPSLNVTAKTLLLGDGDGGSPASTSRYVIKSLPLAWSKTPHSPARRHLDGADYAFADGHVKWLRYQRITTAKTKAVATGNGTFSVE